MKVYTKAEMDQRIEDYLIHGFIRRDEIRKPIVAYRVSFAKEDEIIGIYDSVTDVVHNLNVSAPSVNKSIETGCAIKGITFIRVKPDDDGLDPWVRKIIL